VTGYGLDLPGYDSREKGEKKVVSQIHSVQIGTGAHKISYALGTGGSFSGGQNSRVVKLTTHLHLVLKSGMLELHLHSPISFHGIMSN
jgi:hypothetical protein